MMTGYELLGMAMRGEIKKMTEYKCDKTAILFDIIKERFVWRGGVANFIWTVDALNAEWEKVEPKPKLDDWEKETCRRLLAKGYKWICRDKEGMIYIYSYKPNRENNFWKPSKFSKFIYIFDGFDFITWEDSEPTSIEWLLGSEE